MTRRKAEVHARWIQFLTDRFPLEQGRTYPGYKRRRAGEPDHAKAATFFGCNTNLVGAWVKGAVPPLHSPTMTKAVQVLRLNLTWLATGEGSPHLDEDVAVRADLADQLFNYVVGQLAQDRWDGEISAPSPGAVESRKAQVRRDLGHRPDTLLDATIQGCRETWTGVRLYMHYDVPRDRVQTKTEIRTGVLPSLTDLARSATRSLRRP